MSSRKPPEVFAKAASIETSIPSFYHEVRTEPEMIAQRNWTRQWWDGCLNEYEAVTSEAVLDELSAGDYPTRDRVLSLVNSLPVLPVEPAIVEIVEVYIEHQLMPQDPLGDVLHLALASYYRCDFLLAWNCNTLLGLFVPMLVTPLEILGETDHER